MRRVPVRFPIIVYPSEESDIGRFTAHCLNLDLIADADTVEGAIGNLLETIENHLNAAEEHDAQLFVHQAPREYWERLQHAQKLAQELIERIIREANQRRGHEDADAISVEDQCDIHQVEACA